MAAITVQAQYQVTFFPANPKPGGRLYLQSVDARILKTALWVITGCVTAGVLFHTAAHHAHPQIDHHVHHAHRAHFQMVPTAWRKSGTPSELEMSQEFLFLFPSAARTVDTSKCNATKVTTPLTKCHQWHQKQFLRHRLLLVRHRGREACARIVRSTFKGFIFH